MTSVLDKLKTIIGTIASFLKPVVAWIYGWLKVGIVTSLKPFWVPALNLARNPLTAIMVGAAVIFSFFAGDVYRAGKDYAHARGVEKDYRLKLKIAGDQIAAAQSSARDTSAKMAELQKQYDELKAKPAAVQTIVRMPRKAEPVEVPAKPKWSMF